MIREIGVAKDLPPILQLAGEMWAEGAYKHIPLSPGRIQEQLTNCMTTGFARVATNGSDIPVGFGFAGIQQYVFSDEKLTVDYMFYVNREHRGRMLGFRLIKAYIEWAKEQDVKEIMLGGSFGFDEDDDNYGKLLERVGFERAGLWFKLQSER